MNNHPLFLIYTREFIHEQTGFSKSYLCRISRGRTPLTRSFIERMCYKLKRSEKELFSPEEPPVEVNSSG